MAVPLSSAGPFPFTNSGATPKMTSFHQDSLVSALKRQREDTFSALWGVSTAAVCRARRNGYLRRPHRGSASALRPAPRHASHPWRLRLGDILSPAGLAGLASPGAVPGSVNALPGSQPPVLPAAALLRRQHHDASTPLHRQVITIFILCWRRRCPMATVQG